MLAARPAGAAVDLAGNWSAVTFSSTGTSGFTLSVQKSGANYSCFIDDYDLDFVDYFASHATFNPATLQFHLDWAAPGSFSFDGFVSADGNMLNCVLSNAFGLFPMAIPRQPSAADCLAAVYTNADGPLPYRLFVPTNYLGTNKYPLVIFLHGVGERGTDNVVQLSANIGVLSFISQSNQAAHPCLLVAPQCPTNDDASWIDDIRRGQLSGLLTNLEARYSLDTNRIYITGLSMGGLGTWDQITQNPNLYAAAVPMSGAGDLTLAPLITNVPIWNFHSVNDSVVDVTFSRLMVGAVRSAGGNPIYTEYATGDHPIWPIAYYTPSLVDWVMTQRRGQPPGGFLEATITSPTTNANYATGATNVTLSGTTGDATAAVFGLNAYNVQTGVLSPVSGTTNWTATNLLVQPGATNRLLITAFGTSWSAILGGNTSFSRSLQVAQVAAPIMMTILKNSQGVLLSWSGGVPPYTIQQRTNLSSGSWLGVKATNGTSVTLPLAAPADFYRIQGQ